jgi:Flp pilus assembly protein TadD
MKYITIVFCLFVAACAPMKKQPVQTADMLEQQGLAEMEKGNFDPAIEKFNAVLKKEPTRWKTLNAIGMLHAFKNQMPQSESFFAAADSASGNNPAILNNWGLALAMDGRYDQATAKLMQAVEVAPQEKRMQPEMNLALVYGLMGKESQASMVLRRYMEPKKITENIKSYRAIRSNREKARQALQNAATPVPTTPVEQQLILPPSLQ